MHVLSLTHTIVAPNSAIVLKRAGGPKIPDSTMVWHEPGTVLDLADDEAQDLIERGHVEHYQRSLHGDDPLMLAKRRAGEAAQSAVKTAPDATWSPDTFTQAAAGARASSSR